MNKAYPLLYLILKTIADYAISIFCLIILSPLVVILSALIFFTGKGPVIYAQQRTGKDGKIFMIYKFRSLRHGIDEGIDLISDKNNRRITRVGKVMRKYKLDEIPNFINVVKGDMSIVGPRPEQEYYIEKIVQQASRYMELLNVKPGITSWAKLNMVMPQPWSR